MVYRRYGIMQEAAFAESDANKVSANLIVVRCIRCRKREPALGRWQRSEAWRREQI